jgi:hypothetical protein
MGLVCGNGSAFKLRLTTGEPVVEGSFGHPVTISVICCSGADVISQEHSLLHVLLLIVSETKAEEADVAWRGMKSKKMNDNRKERIITLVNKI